VANGTIDSKQHKHSDISSKNETETANNKCNDKKCLEKTNKLACYHGDRTAAVAQGAAIKNKTSLL